MSAPGKDTAAHFSRQAEAYAASPGHANGQDLDIVAAFAQPGLHDLCLDIATGPGHTAFRIASKAMTVVAVDIAEGMLATGRRLAAERGITNVVFERADAAHLSFNDASFDLVTCRIAPHHFTDIPGFLSEVARVLKANGRFVLEDSLAPDDPQEAAFLHELEVRRDPTHVRSLQRDEWIAALQDAGLKVTRDMIFQKQHPFADWLARTGVEESAAAILVEELLAAPAALRNSCLVLGESGIEMMIDHKIILRADKLIN
ncbi:MAG: methyltransferase domain-containing protein [Rhodovibrionaceae bacterium]